MNLKQTCWHLGCTLPLSDDVIQAVGDVCVQSSGQIPGLADPVVVLPSENNSRNNNQIINSFNSTWTFLLCALFLFPLFVYLLFLWYMCIYVCTMIVSYITWTNENTFACLSIVCAVGVCFVVRHKYCGSLFSFSVVLWCLRVGKCTLWITENENKILWKKENSRYNYMDGRHQTTTSPQTTPICQTTPRNSNCTHTPNYTQTLN